MTIKVTCLVGSQGPLSVWWKCQKGSQIVNYHIGSCLRDQTMFWESTKSEQDTLEDYPQKNNTLPWHILNIGDGKLAINSWSEDFLANMEICVITHFPAKSCECYWHSANLSCSINVRACCRRENSPIWELPTETDLMARACHYYYPKIYNEFDM